MAEDNKIKVLSDREARLRELLNNHQYESSVPGRGMRGLMQHHVDALTKELLPFIEAELAREETSVAVRTMPEPVPFEAAPVTLSIEEAEDIGLKVPDGADSVIVYKGEHHG